MHEGRQGLHGLEMEAAAMQCPQRAQRFAAAIRVDAIQRPAAAGTGDIVAKRIAAGAGAADADDAIPCRCQQPGHGGLADTQCLPQCRSGQRAVAAEQVFNPGGTQIGHRPIE